jgi:hypothetical protein
MSAQVDLRQLDNVQWAASSVNLKMRAIFANRLGLREWQGA